MSYVRVLRIFAVSALFTALGGLSARANNIKTVFVIAMENHDWTQPAHQFNGKIQQIFQNPNAPFINSLVNGTATAVINGSAVQISKQVAYAAKHNPPVCFTDTNGGHNATPTNPLSTRYAPLQQLQIDLANNTVANYNWITPDQYNDMHPALTGGFKGLKGDEANIAQGD